MKTIMIALSLSLTAVACQSSGTALKASDDSRAQQFAMTNVVTVPEVASFVQQHDATIVDANGADTRREMGVVPGALLLSDSHDYPLSELPAAKSSKLVFYCGGELCRASDAAAARATKAGYTDVNVMRAGIRGWKSAGNPTQLPRS